MPYLFSRNARMAPGSYVDALTWAVTMTEKVNTVSDVSVALWSDVLSPEVGTLGWTAVLENVSEITALDEKLSADEGYLALAEEGAHLVSADGFHDGLVNIVHADPDGLDTAQYAAVTTSVVAAGATATGIPLGVEMAQRVRSITGRPTSFGLSMTGRFGEVGWIALAETIDQVQAAEEAMAADAGWIEMLDTRAAEAFVRSESSRRITRKLA